MRQFICVSVCLHACLCLYAFVCVSALLIEALWSSDKAGRRFIAVSWSQIQVFLTRGNSDSSSVDADHKMVLSNGTMRWS